MRRSAMVALAICALVTVLGAPAILAADPAPDEGLVARWTFEEGSGAVVSDVTGHGHEGELLGTPAWVTTDPAQGSAALHLNAPGSGSSWVRVADAADLHLTSLTVLAWVKPDAVANGGGTLVAKGDRDCGAATWAYAVAPYVSSVPEDSALGYLESRQWATTGGFTYLRSVGGPIARLFDGGWHLVAYTYDDATGASSMVVDGAAVYPSEAPGFLDSLPGAQDIGIGSVPVDCARDTRFEGVVDDVRLYDRALTSAEINALLPHVETTLTVEWPSAGMPGDIAVPVHVEPPPSGGGRLELVEVTASGEELRAEVSPHPVTGNATLWPGALTDGDHLLKIRFVNGGINLDAVSDTHVVHSARVAGVATLTSSASEITIGAAAMLRATVSVYAETIELWRSFEGEPAELVASQGPVLTSDGYSAVFTDAPDVAGRYTYMVVVPETALYLGTSSEVPVVLVVNRRATSLYVHAGEVRQENHTLTLDVEIGRDISVDYSRPSGVITFADGDRELGAAEIVDLHAQLVIPSLDAGVHIISATYAGDRLFAPSAVTLPLDILADTVDAIGLAPNYAKFYPFTDGYRDSVSIDGYRNEPASVEVRLYAPSGTLKRTTVFPMAEEAYTWSWTGRTKSGRLMPEGTYRISQILVDAAGTRRSVTSWVTLSHKRLVTRSMTLTQDSTQLDRRNIVEGWAAWRFTLPAAVVYRKLVFSVNGKTNGEAYFGAHRFTGDGCSAVTQWNPYCSDPRGRLRGSYEWRSVTGDGQNANGRVAKLYVWVSSGKAWVRYGRVNVTYGVLK